MKKLYIVALIAIGATSPALAQGQHYVQGYTRSNGTYVAPHYQTNPDASRANNWSAQGNVNPYTGQAGTVDPYAQPAPSPYEFPASPYAAPPSPYTPR